MKTEVRVYDHRLLLNRAFCRALDGAGIAEVSFGSESCYRQLPPMDEADRIVDTFGPERLKLLVPLAFESHFDTVASYVERYLDRVGTVSVNDLGMLRYLLRRHGDRDFHVAFGAGLFYSYMECPWHNHIIRDEPPKVRDAMLQGNMESGWMIEFFREFVGRPLEIEMPAIPSLCNDSAAMRQAGFELSALLDGVPISFARACHTCRYHQVQPAKCSRQCMQKVRLKSTHWWDFFEGDVKEIRPVIQQQMPDLLVWGNAIYVENQTPFSIHAVPGISKVIVDTRFGADIGLITRKFAETGITAGVPDQAHQAPAPITAAVFVSGDGVDAITARLRQIVARILKVAPDLITPESRYVEDLAADSVSVVRLILAFEDEFGIEIDQREAIRLRTVAMTTAYLQNRHHHQLRVP